MTTAFNQPDQFVGQRVNELFHQSIRPADRDLRRPGFLPQSEMQPRVVVRNVARLTQHHIRLPQFTGLALNFGQIVSGAVLVEVIFSYPGMGWILWNAIKNTDYFLIQGIVYVLVLSVALAMLLVDLTYPLIDPRIGYGRR